MTSAPGNCLVSFLKHPTLFSLIALLFIATPATAEPLMLMKLHSVRNDVQWLDTTHLTVKRQSVVSLDDNGDMVIRCGEISLTVAYSPPNEIVEPQERTRISQRQDCPSISGISIRVAFLF